MRYRLAVLCASIFLCLTAPALATDRTIWYPQQTTTSTGLNLAQRQQRLAFGTWLLHALNLSGGSGTGVYANLTTSASTGLYVTTAPTLTSSLGALYQVQQDDTQLPAGCPTPVTTCGQLAADTTLIAVPGFQGGISSPIGPLTAPTTSGQSVYWLIEAQVTTSVDNNSQAQQFLIATPPSGYTPQQFSVNITRTDQVTYQAVEGTPGTSPTEPSVDSGWIAIAYVLVPYSTTQITSGMITASPPFTGFSIGGGTITAVNSGTNANVTTSGSSVTVNVVNNPTFSGAVTASQFNGSGAGLQTGTIPEAALVTAPITGVSGSSPIVSSTASGLTSLTCPTCALNNANNSFSASQSITGSVNASQALIAGFGTAFIPSIGDLSASDGTSAGGIDLGGTSAHCRIDYGDTTSGVLTHACSTNITGALNASQAISAGNATIGSMTNGDLGASRSTTTGAWKVGGSSANCLFDFNVSNAFSSTFQSGCGTVYINGGGGTGLVATGTIASDSTLFAGSTFGAPSFIYAGGIYGAIGTGSGLLGLGTSTSSAQLDWNYSLANSFTLTPGTCSGCVHSPLAVNGSLVANASATWANGPTLNQGDLGASESTTQGQVCLGGSSSQDCIDYGVTHAGIETHSKSVEIPALYQNAANNFAGTATNSSSTTSTATIAASYVTAPLCFAQDQATSNAVNATCVVSSMTVTVTNTRTSFGGSCSMSSTTTCTITAPYAFTSSTCFSQPSTAAAIASTCSISGTTITVTAGSSGSLTWNVLLSGTPSATGHTFSYITVGNAR